MAQDFYSIVGVGENDKTITGIDPDGITLAAIQGLNRELNENLRLRDAQTGGLQKQIEQSKQLVRAENRSRACAVRKGGV